MLCLIDTNILIYLYDVASPHHAAARALLRALFGQGMRFRLAPQVLYEFWVMATRPIADGGLGFHRVAARREIQDLAARYPMLDDSMVTWDEVIDLAVAEGVVGRRIHDARMIAVMRRHGVADVASFDAAMDGFSGIRRHASTP